MYRKLTDTVILLILLTLPLFGVLQACGNNGPVGPGSTRTATNNNAPTALVEVIGDTKGPTPFTVELDGTGSSDPDGDDLTFEWQFSDGTILEGPIVEHEFTSSGKYDVQLEVTDVHDASDTSDPETLYSWGLANSAWPKFAHDERNSGYTENIGPMMDLEHADEGGAWPRYWRGGIQNDLIGGICVGYDNVVIYTQGEWLRARTADGATLWDWLAELKITGWPAILHDGSIVIGTESGWVHRISEDGDLIWSTNISAEVGETVNLKTAVNIDSNGQIYIGGFLASEDGPMETRGRLFSLDLEGTILWTRIIPHTTIMRDSGAFPDARMIPAVMPSGNIVINGLGGRIFTPSGELIAELEYDPDPRHEDERAFGPPSVGEDGKIVFSNPNWPVFNSDGSFSEHLFFDTGYPIRTGTDLAAVHGPESIDFLWTNRYEFRAYVGTQNDQGDKFEHKLNFQLSPRLVPIGEGLAMDGAGRTYSSAVNLYAISPMYPSSEYPYFQRHSLWSYGRPSNWMTPPVIGDDRWLYVGYGNDILAVGD